MISNSSFMFDPSAININHGSFGSTPKTVFQGYCKYKKLIAFSNWLSDDNIYDMILERLQMLGTYLSCDPKNLTFTPNVTTAFNSICQSILNDGDIILVTNMIYGAFSKVLEHFQTKIKFNVLFLTFDLEDIKTKEKMLEKVENVLKNNKKIKLFLFDHISSFPSFIFPVKELCDMTSKYNVLSVVDGAHAVGSIDVDFRDFNADFYFSNLHKWFYTPRGAAFLFVKPALQKFMRSTVINPYSLDRDWRKSFVLESRSYISSYLSVKEAIEFRNSIGDQKIKYYTKKIAYSGAKFFCEKFGTKLLIDNPDILGPIVSFWVPIKRTETLTELSDYLMEKFKIFFVLKKMNQNMAAMRISGQIFLSMKDVELAYEILVKNMNEIPRPTIKASI